MRVRWTIGRLVIIDLDLFTIDDDDLPEPRDVHDLAVTHDRETPSIGFHAAVNDAPVYDPEGT